MTATSTSWLSTRGLKCGCLGCQLYQLQHNPESDPWGSEPLHLCAEHQNITQDGKVTPRGPVRSEDEKKYTSQSGGSSWRRKRNRL